MNKTNEQEATLRGTPGLVELDTLPDGDILVADATKGTIRILSRSGLLEAVAYHYYSQHNASRDLLRTWQD